MDVPHFATMQMNKHGFLDFIHHKIESIAPFWFKVCGGRAGPLLVRPSLSRFCSGTLAWVLVSEPDLFSLRKISEEYLFKVAGLLEK